MVKGKGSMQTYWCEIRNTGSIPCFDNSIFDIDDDESFHGSDTDSVTGKWEV